MAKIIEGDLLAGKARLAIVVSRFNDFITNRLVDGALDSIERHGGKADDVTVAYVPGSFELPLVAKKLATSGKFDAVISLGAVIRGNTPHYDYIASEMAKGIGQAALESGVPIVFGVITADSLEQAIERAGTKQGNTGAKAAITAIEMVNLIKKLP